MASEEAARWALELTARASVNGTPDEGSFAGWLAGRLADTPGFTRVWTIPVPAILWGGRPWRRWRRVRAPGRSCSPGISTPSTSRTTAIWPRFAFRPYQLRAALLEHLAAQPAEPAAALALADLRSGEFLPGRGLLDMKAGLAAELAAIGACAVDSDRRGNLLFVAVPDEEGNSAGARAVVQALPAELERTGLELDAAINLDAILDNGDGAEGGRWRSARSASSCPPRSWSGAPRTRPNAEGINAGRSPGRWRAPSSGRRSSSTAPATRWRHHRRCWASPTTGQATT